MWRLLAVLVVVGAALTARAEDANHSHADDSDLPKRVEKKEKGKVPAFLGFFGPKELIEKVGFRSSVGSYIEYKVTNASEAARLRFSEVGPQVRGARWIEITGDAGPAVGGGVRILTRGEGDGNLERIIFKGPDVPIMEVPVDSADIEGTPMAKGRDKQVLKLVGRETVKVPLGTFETDRWLWEVGDGTRFEWWIATDRSLPFTGAVKFEGPEGLAVAVKTGKDAKPTIAVPGRLQ